MKIKKRKAYFYRLPTLLLAIAASCLSQAETEGEGRGLEKPVIADFRLVDHKGLGHQLTTEPSAIGQPKAIVIVSQGNGCPASQNSFSALADLKKQYESRGVVFLLLNANRQDSRAEIERESLRFHNEIPILIDDSQIVALALGFRSTGEALLIDSRTWKAIYRGPVDDRIDCGLGRKPNGKPWLNMALEQFLAGQVVAEKEKPATGCAISFEKQDSLTFGNPISAIIERRCAICHREGIRIGPVFSDYSKVKAFAPMIARVLMMNQMPPWTVDSHYSEFESNLSLTPLEKFQLYHWAIHGASLGAAGVTSGEKPPRDKSGADFPAVYGEAPAEKTKPDLWLNLDSNARIPASGLIDDELFRLGGPTEKDMWVKSVTSVLITPFEAHHQSIIVSSRSLEQLKELVRKKAKGPIAATEHSLTYLPQTAEELAKDPAFVRLRIQSYSGGGVEKTRSKGIALFVPKGSHIFLATHFAGSGFIEELKMKIGLSLFSPESGTQPLKTLIIDKKNFTLKKMERNQKIESEAHIVPRDIRLVSYFPHLHMRGSSVRLHAQDKSGKDQILFSEPFFSYSWQRDYDLKEPRRIEKGTKIWAEAVYDNSPLNPINPDPNVEVVAGDGPSREALKFTITYAEADAGVSSRANHRKGKK